MNDLTAYGAARKKVGSWHRTSEEQRVPLTHEELEALGDDAVRDHNAYQEKLMDEEPSVGHLEPVAKTYFTCYRCAAASTCPYVYDLYNTNGDCLASK